MKQCRACFKDIAEKDFSKSKANRDGLGSYCKPCKYAKSSLYKASSEKFKARLRTYQLSRYGLTQETYNSLLKLQNGNCAICKEFRTRGTEKVLHIDHDHSTGKVRGLLCITCNTTIGRYENAREAIDKYLGGV